MCLAAASAGAVKGVRGSIALVAIRILPPELVNQIAAGEVVERPASVVKELIENAIDSGARRIGVRIEGGGRDLIEVIDDGAGIPAEELVLAVTSHATSKIRSSEDLGAISTLGFRGEALASIGSVSRLEIVSRPRGQSDAARILVAGGVLEGPAPAAGAVGTLVRVSTLFFNVPARRKFLKSEAAEAGRVTELIETMALVHPEVSFRLDSGSRRVLDLPAAADRRGRVNDLLGPDVKDELLEVDARGGAEGGSAISVWGVVARPSAARATGRHQRLYVNGRWVTDRSLLHAIKEAFRGVIDPSRHPVAVLQIDVEPSEVDVNVHPAKTEVRFRQPSAVYSFLLRAVRSTLRAADLVPMFGLDSASGGEETPSPAGSGGRSWSGGAGDSIRGPGAPRRAGFDFTSLEAQLARREGLDPSYTGATTQKTGATEEKTGATADGALERSDGAGATIVEAREPPESALPTLLRAGAVLQVHQSYLIMEDAEGVVVIDQHALHERVLYEQLFERVMRGGLERQMLLAPLMVETGPRAAERVEALSPLLARLGFEATSAGPRTVAVHAVPSFLASRRVDAGEFLFELLERDDVREEPGRDGLGNEAAIHRIIDMMACKAAVKAGERLTAEEIARLLAAREHVERSTNCPHGRPTSLRIPLREIEKRFGR